MPDLCWFPPPCVPKHYFLRKNYKQLISTSHDKIKTLSNKCRSVRIQIDGKAYRAFSLVFDPKPFCWPAKGSRSNLVPTTCGKYNWHVSSVAPSPDFNLDCT